MPGVQTSKFRSASVCERKMRVTLIRGVITGAEKDTKVGKQLRAPRWRLRGQIAVKRVGFISAHAPIGPGCGEAFIRPYPLHGAREGGIGLRIHVGGQGKNTVPVTRCSPAPGTGGAKVTIARVARGLRLGVIQQNVFQPWIIGGNRDSPPVWPRWRRSPAFPSWRGHSANLRGSTRRWDRHRR